MDQDRWDEIERVFDAVLDAPANKRKSVLNAQTAHDPELREAVVRLLDAEARAGDFLSQPLSRDATMGTGANPPVSYALAAGDKLGAWNIVRPLGAGGMGEVYLAERDAADLRQQAAIKRSASRDPALIARFTRERQIVADLDHPNIARLLDGGLDGHDHPFMAMEYVDGRALLDFCRANDLGIDARLELFLTVCDAVGYAHQRLIVHRDIKPGNVLVRADGTPKLMDFGIAAMLAEPVNTSIAQGHATQGLFTPNYAAPEQLAGGEITTATDVHGLGATLYALLTDAPPWRLDKLPLPTAVNRLLHTDAPRPSDHAPALRRHRLGADLDAICAKAMRKEPGARYESAQAMAGDLRNARALRPVRARQGTRRYVMGRFVRRNRLAVAATAAVLVLLVSALTLTSWFAYRASVERDTALREAARLTAMRTSMVRILNEATQAEADGPLTAVGLLDNAVARMNEDLADDPASMAAMRQMIGELYLAMDDYARAGPLLEQVVTMDAPQIPPGIIARAQYDLAQVRFEGGDTEATRKAFDAALAIWEADAPTFTAELIHAASMDSRLRRLDGDTAGAVAALETAVERADAHWGRQHEETARVLSNLVVAHFFNNDLAAAQAASAETWAVWQAIGQTDTPDALSTLSNWGAIARRRGDLVTAAQRMEQATSVRERLYGPSAALATQLLNVAKLQADNGEVQSALTTIGRARTMALEFGEAGDPLTTATGCQTGRLQLMAEEQNRALQTLEATLADMKPGTENDMVGAECRMLRGQALAMTGQFDAADAALKQAKRALTEAGPAGQQLLSDAHRYHGALALYRGDGNAADHYREALALKTALQGAQHHNALLTQCELGRALVASGDADNGQRLMDEAIAALQDKLGREHAIVERARAIRDEASI